MPRTQRPTVETPVLADGLQYLELRNHIAARIAAGELKPGDRLPSERQLQTTSRIARGTIREGLSQLEAEGLIYRKDRSGSYVSPSPIVYDPTRWEGFISYVEAQGRRPSTETLDAVEIAADGFLAGVFDRPLDAPLYLIRRRRHIDGRAVLVEHIVVDVALAPDLLRFLVRSVADEHSEGGIRAVRHPQQDRDAALRAHRARSRGAQAEVGACPASRWCAQATTPAAAWWNSIANIGATTP